MTIRQISVFLENKTGRINEVAKILGNNGINMKAFSMAETADFGILRLIVSEVEKAVAVLRDANFAVMLTEVVCLNVPNVAGALAGILDATALFCRKSNLVHRNTNGGVEFLPACCLNQAKYYTTVRVYSLDC
jgi:hypothetical protein